MLLRHSLGLSSALPMECDFEGEENESSGDTNRVTTTTATTLSGTSGGGWQLEPRQNFLFRLGLDLISNFKMLSCSVDNS